MTLRLRVNVVLRWRVAIARSCGFAVGYVMTQVRTAWVQYGPGSNNHWRMHVPI